jgi:putative protein-disulfide isomerase
MIKNQSEKIKHKGKKDQVEITYYTDPLCCWSWAFEPQWRKLRYQFEGQLKWKYVMGGLIPDWKTYHDPLNSVTRPLQMGPLWFEARHISGQPINDKVWINDAPQSSYPACIAAKCAEIQSQGAGELYLRALREAVMLKGQNVGKQSVLLEIAETVSEAFHNQFDYEKFKSDLQENKGTEGFKSDLQKVSFHKIGRFPSLVIKNTLDGRAVIIVGYRPYSVLMDALKAVAPEIQPSGKSLNKDDYIDFWKGATNREVEELFSENHQPSPEKSPPIS